MPGSWSGQRPLSPSEVSWSSPERCPRLRLAAAPNTNVALDEADDTEVGDDGAGSRAQAGVAVEAALTSGTGSWSGVSDGLFRFRLGSRLAVSPGPGPKPGTC